MHNPLQVQRQVDHGLAQLEVIPDGLLAQVSALGDVLVDLLDAHLNEPQVPERWPR